MMIKNVIGTSESMGNPLFESRGLMACVTCVWAGVDSVWEQEKLEARKMLVNRADSHTSTPRFV
jgi:hypothetical protein